MYLVRIYGLGALIYANEFMRDAIDKCGEASLEFPHKVFLGKKESERKNI
jgi:hypothetical protein